MRNTKAGIKNILLDGINHRLEMEEDKIIELEDNNVNYTK